MKKRIRWGMMVGMGVIVFLTSLEGFGQVDKLSNPKNTDKLGLSLNGAAPKLSLLEFDLNDLSNADNCNRVKHNGKLMVKITNVNRLVYDVQVVGSSNSYHTEMPTMWSGKMLEVDGGASPISEEMELLEGKRKSDGVVEAYQSLEHIKSEMASLQIFATSPALNSHNVIAKRVQWVNTVSGLALADEEDTTAQLSKHYFQVLKDWESELMAFESLPDSVKGSEGVKAQVELLKAKARLTDYPKLVADLLTLYDWLVPSSFVYESDPIYPEGNADEVEVNIAINPRTGMENPYLQPRQFTRVLPVKGGWKLDFSTGVVGFSIPEESYLMVAMQDTQLVILKEERSNKYNVGLSALLHAHYRSGNYLSFGGSVGIAVGKDQPTRYLAGGSLLIGRWERMILSGGLAYGAVNQLSNAQKVDNLYPLGTKVEMVPRYRLGGFFGISYNLGK